MKLVATILLIFVAGLCAWVIHFCYSIFNSEAKTALLSPKEAECATWDMRIAVVVFTLAIGFLSMGGCTTVRVELEHISHPLAGPPFGPVTEEDSINQLNACVARNFGASDRMFVENCLGYKIGDGGFFGPRLTYTGRVGIQWGRRN